jgi:hypothetical protein
MISLVGSPFEVGKIRMKLICPMRMTRRKQYLGFSEIYS